MRKNIGVFFALASVFILAACGGNGNNSKGPEGGQDYTDPVTGMEFIWIPAGAFVMGNQHGTSYNNIDLPAHAVTITKGFWLGKYEVTQSQWQAIMGSNPSATVGTENPVDSVSWNDAQAFITALNAKPGAETVFRLPTEAEWELAAKGETGQDFAGTNSDLDADLSQYAWYSFNSGGITHPVGQKLPNSYGLYDMSGNVWEWTQDYFGYYTAEAKINPTGPATGTQRVTKSGGWMDNPQYIRTSYRCNDDPDEVSDYIGLRLAIGK